MGGWAAAWCSWRLFVRRQVRLLVYTLLCLRRLTRRVRAWAYLVAAWRLRALLRVFHGVVLLSLFFRVALCVWGGLFPLMLSHTLLVSWRPRPMRAGDDSGRAHLLVVARLLCPFPRALRTSAFFRRVAAWPIV